MNFSERPKEVRLTHCLGFKGINVDIHSFTIFVHWPLGIQHDILVVSSNILLQLIVTLENKLDFLSFSFPIGLAYLLLTL